MWTGVEYASPLVGQLRPLALLKTEKSRKRLSALVQALKYLALVPLFPMLGYLLLDQTGVSAWLVMQGVVPHQIMGEGFGHVGLCFSIHYVGQAVRYLWQGLTA